MIDQERLTRQFLQFVQVDSPVFSEAPFGELLGEELTKLDLRWENDRTGQNGAGNLLTVLPGTTPGIPPVLLCMPPLSKGGEGGFLKFLANLRANPL